MMNPSRRAAGDSIGLNSLESTVANVRRNRPLVTRASTMCIGLLLACCICLGLAAPVDADSFTWSEPVRVSTPIANQFDWFPSVAADDNGNVHIVWNSTPGEGGNGLAPAAPDATGQLEYVRWSGSSWTEQSDISLIWYGYPARNSLTVDRNGTLHLIYKGWSSPGEHQGQDLWYSSTEGARANTYSAWSNPVRINRSDLAYFPIVRLDGRGVIHALWTESDGQGKWAIYYANSHDAGATWSKPFNFEDSQPVWWYRAEMIVDAHDALHVVYELGGQDKTSTGLTFGTTRATVYAESTDGGLLWSKHVFGGQLKVSNTSTTEMLTPGPQQPAIGVDGEQNRLLVYRQFGSNRILFRESADGVHWSEAQPVPGIRSGVDRPYDVYDLATDSAGHVHLVAVGYPTGSDAMRLLHSEWNGQNWSRAEVISTPPPFPEYPRLAIGQGNRLHVVWFTGDKAGIDRTPNGIWYSTALTDAPKRLGLLGAAPEMSAASRASTPLPAPTVAAVPTPMPLAEAARLNYDGGRDSQRSSLADQPAIPILVAVLTSSILLIMIIGVQLRSTRQP